MPGRDSVLPSQQARIHKDDRASPPLLSLKGNSFKRHQKILSLSFFPSQCESQGSNPRPLKEQQVLLTTDLLFTIDDIFL